MSARHQQESVVAPDVPAPRPPEPNLPYGLAIAYGAVTVVLGVIVLAWPRATLIVVVGLLSAQLLIWGGVQVVAAVTERGAAGGARVVAGLSGGLSLLAGLLILRRPLQTLVVVTLVVGAWWIVRGVLDLVSVLPGGAPGSWWNALFGAVSLVAGIYVILQPEISLGVFVVVTGVWMLAHGAVVLIAALVLRRRDRVA